MFCGICSRRDGSDGAIKDSGVSFVVSVGVVRDNVCFFSLLQLNEEIVETKCKAELLTAA